MRILIVDDSNMVRRQVAMALSGAGFTVVEACDGIDAQDKLSADTSLVVCDVNMPRMNGLELLAKIREDQQYAQLPIVMLTTEAQTGMYERARALGAKAWIVKPFKADLLLAAVRKLVAASPQA
jgi:two-component system chemotaxis response regulator CheY